MADSRMAANRRRGGGGRQAYVVAARIDGDGDKKDGDKKTATKGGGAARHPVGELYERLPHRRVGGLRLGLMHGRPSADEKDAVMAAFQAARWMFWCRPR